MKFIILRILGILYQYHFLIRMHIFRAPNASSFLLPNQLQFLIALWIQSRNCLKFFLNLRIGIEQIELAHVLHLVARFRLLWLSHSQVYALQWGVRGGSQVLLG